MLFQAGHHQFHMHTHVFVLRLRLGIRFSHSLSFTSFIVLRCVNARTQTPDNFTAFPRTKRKTCIQSSTDEIPLGSLNYQF